MTKVLWDYQLHKMFIWDWKCHKLMLMPISSVVWFPPPNNAILLFGLPVSLSPLLTKSLALCLRILYSRTVKSHPCCWAHNRPKVLQIMILRKWWIEAKVGQFWGVCFALFPHGNYLGGWLNSTSCAGCVLSLHFPFLSQYNLYSPN